MTKLKFWLDYVKIFARSGARRRQLDAFPARNSWHSGPDWRRRRQGQGNIITARRQTVLDAIHLKYQRPPVRRDGGHRGPFKESGKDAKDILIRYAGHDHNHLRERDLTVTGNPKTVK